MKQEVKMNQASALLTSDWHLTDKQPLCRTDDFWSAQWFKVRFIKELQQKHECPVYHAGDLFDTWKTSPYLLAQTMLLLPFKFRTIFGQHDLPNHSMELMNKCGLYALAAGRHLDIVLGASHGQVPKSSMCETIGGHNLLLWHHLTWHKEKPWSGCTEPSAIKLLKKYKNYDVILTGDNHQTFVAEYKGRLLVNPGSLTRQKADQVDHKPCVFLYYAKTNSVEQVFLPFEKNVISREHITSKKKHDKRIEAFVSRFVTSLKEHSDYMTFEENLKRFAIENKLDKRIMKTIYEAMEE